VGRPVRVAGAGVLLKADELRAKIAEGEDKEVE
jgi:hypothetical protein